MNLAVTCPKALLRLTATCCCPPCPETEEPMPGRIAGDRIFQFSRGTVPKLTSLNQSKSYCGVYGGLNDVQRSVYRLFDR